MMNENRSSLEHKEIAPKPLKTGNGGTGVEWSLPTPCSEPGASAYGCVGFLGKVGATGERPAARHPMNR